MGLHGSLSDPPADLPWSGGASSGRQTVPWDSGPSRQVLGRGRQGSLSLSLSLLVSGLAAGGSRHLDGSEAATTTGKRVQEQNELTSECPSEIVAATMALEACGSWAWGHCSPACLLCPCSGLQSPRSQNHPRRLAEHLPGHSALSRTHGRSCGCASLRLCAHVFMFNMCLRICVCVSVRVWTQLLRDPISITFMSLATSLCQGQYPPPATF